LQVQLPRPSHPDGSDASRSGPFRPWCLAQEDCRWIDFVCHYQHDWLRHCGCVLWDESNPPVRDEDLKRYIAEALRQSLLHGLRHKDQERRMRQSWMARREICARGGREYWSEKDISCVIWTVGHVEKLAAKT